MVGTAATVVSAVDDQADFDILITRASTVELLKLVSVAAVVVAAAVVGEAVRAAAAEVVSVAELVT